jgi:hypothetical protein
MSGPRLGGQRIARKAARVAVRPVGRFPVAPAPETVTLLAECAARARVGL